MQEKSIYPNLSSQERKEQVVEIKTCKNCNVSFEITDKDLEFYEKVSPCFASPSIEGDGGGVKKYLIPSPTICPDCRQQRRLSFRNERYLYKNKCRASGKDVISIYSPDKPYKIYDQKEWWSDKWNTLDYGRNFDFSRSFFEQFEELMINVPKCNVIIQNCENSDYTNYSADNKSCYLCASSHRCENTYYSYRCHDTYECIDCINTNNSNYCYEVIDSENCNKLFYSQMCEKCFNSYFLYDCKGCDNSIFCVGLRNKKYCIFNKEYTKEEYSKKLSELKESFSKLLKKYIIKYQELLLSSIHISINNIGCENCLGDFLYNSKNVKNAFFLQNSEDSSYLTDGRNIKQSIDLTNPDDIEFSYENSSSINNYNVSFSYHIGWSKNLYYCDFCMNCNNCFGCISLNNNEYCILNKQYTKEEYEILVPKIIEHMISTGEWGEFFPSSISPFAYNETVANEYFPLNKEEIIEKGFKYREEEDKNYNGNVYIPLNTSEYDEKIVSKEIADKNISEILNGIIKCEITGKPFRIIKQELDFYIKHNLPIPKKHPDQRHLDRMKLRNPRKLFDRKCDKCKIDMKTTYSPDRKEIVYCEDCYNKEVY